MTKEQRQIENHLLIENKDRKVVRFKLNPIQERYDSQRTNRDIILKARQQGFSSLILAYFLIDCLVTPNTKSVVVSHETDATQRLLRRVKLFIERFYSGDDFVQIPLSYNSKSEIYFPETNSSFYIGTAGSRSFGRGDVINNLHVSEFALFPDPKEFLTGILPAVPQNGRVIIETTAKGFNYFKEIWDRSRRQDSGFTPHFFSWWLNPEYQMTGNVEPLNEEESTLKDTYNLTDAQVLWWRARKKEFDDLVYQEYPSDEFEAFISSGRPVFNQQILKKYLSRCSDPKNQGYINELGQFTANDKGFVKIWEWPNPQESYVIGADVAEGLEHGDYSSGKVLSRRTFKQIASWQGHVDPDVFAKELVGLGKFYHNAVIGCERNNHGIAVVSKLRELGYKALYKRQSLDKVQKATISEFGWRTDVKTKPLMIDELAQSLREESIDIPEKETILELLSFERDEMGRMGAPASMFDDQVIALAIAVQMRKLTSPMDVNYYPDYPEGTAGKVFQEIVNRPRYEDILGNPHA